MRSPMTNSPSVWPILPSAPALEQRYARFMPQRGCLLTQRTASPEAETAAPGCVSFSSAPAIQAASLLSPALLLILYLLDPRPEAFIVRLSPAKCALYCGNDSFRLDSIKKPAQNLTAPSGKERFSSGSLLPPGPCIHLIGLFKRTGEWKEIRHTQHADRRLSPAEPAKRSKARRKGALSEPLI